MAFKILPKNHQVFLIHRIIKNIFQIANKIHLLVETG